MKKYISNKEVLAEPMGYIEFIQYMDLDSEAMVNKPGYMVDSGNGRISWWPKDDFESKYKPSETFLERLTIEHSELEEKYKKLSVFINSNKAFAGLEEAEQKDLLFQHNTMQEYLLVLNARLNARIERASQNA